MPFGLTTFQALTIIAPIIGALIMVLVNVVQYDKQENSEYASQAKLERWENVKREYGRIVSKHHREIENAPNTFIDLSDPEDCAETMNEFIEDSGNLLELQAKITKMKQPEKYHRRCRKGAEWAPFAYLGSLGVSLLALVYSSNFFYLAGFLFIAGAALTGVFLLYRSKVNGLADEVQFAV